MKIQIRIARSILGTFPAIVALITFIMGLEGLAGWIFDIPLLRSLLPGAVEMKANTAIGLMLSAGGLFALAIRSSRLDRLARGSGLLVMALGMATLGEYLFGWQLGIDELLFRDTGNAYNLIRGRMSPYSAGIFAMLGTALAIAPWRRFQSLVWLASIAVIAIAVISILGYLWNASELVTDHLLPPVALNTAIAFTLLGVGILRSSWESEQKRLSLTAVETRILAGFISAFVLMACIGGVAYQASAKFGSDEGGFWRNHELVLTLLLVMLVAAVAIFAMLFLGIHQEIKARSKTQQQLADSEENLSVTLDSIGDAVIATDDKGCITRMNAVAEQLTGWSQLKARGRPIAEVFNIINQQTRESAPIPVAATLAEGVIHGLANDTVLIASDGTERPIADSCAPIRNREGVVIGAVLVFRDVMREYETQTALRNSTARIHAVLNTVADGIVTINECGIVETMNPAAELLFGYAATDVIGQNVSMLMPEPDRSLHNGYIERYCATGEARIIGQGREVTGRHRSGSTFPMYLAIGEMKLNGQRYFTGVVHDLTEQKQAEESLQQAKETAEMANRAKDSFLATMSHEIRTPLTGMLGMLEVLSLTPMNHEQEGTLRAAWDSARNLLRIVNDILDWSKIQEGKLDIVPLPTSISKLLQEVINTYAHIASSKGLILKHSIDEKISHAHIVDGLRLSQVLNNFVSNAIKFTPGGNVTVTAELLEKIENHERIRFSVRDTGIGISKDAQFNLFQRYQQGDVDTARMYGGTGLGLAICLSLMELMDGQIELVSEPGNGSTFSIVLIMPVSEAPKGELRLQDLTVMRRAVKPLFDSNEIAPLVLAVDDHPINRDLLLSQLKLLGLRAETAENGEEALVQWQEKRFGLVITDCHMPGMDGYEFSKSVRKIESAKQLQPMPIIAWTANALEDEAQKCYAAGMDALLTKPANLTQLREVLARWLPAPDLRRSGTVQDAEPIDFNDLNKVMPDSSKHKSILRDYYAHLCSDHDKLIQLLERADRSGVAGLAHRMKGSSMMVGARIIAKICAEIEQTARVGDLNSAQTSAMGLQEAIRQLESVCGELPT
jgi:PAS domain S-box-containing protein